jgi:hypothetical protein
MMPTSTSAAPSETGVYTEDFSLYTNKDYIQDAQWDIWSHSLRLRRTDGALRSYPAVARNPLDSSVMVVWQDESNGNNDIYLQKLDANGNKLWPVDVRLNSDTGSAEQYTPAIAINSSGIAFVVWQDQRSDGYGIYAQKVDMNGNRLWANDIRVSAAGRCNDAKPAIAIDSSGGFVLVWQAQVSCGIDSNVYMQRINSSGNRLWANDIRINSDVGTATQSVPDIAINATGRIAVVWQDNRNGNDDIYAQQFDINGTKLWGADVLVNSDGGTSSQRDPSVAIASDASSVVTWSGNDIFAQSLSSSGMKRWAADIQVNSVSTGGQWYPTVAVSPNGNFFIAWNDHRVANFTAYIYAQLINVSGNRLWASDVRVSDEPDYFGYPDLAIDSSGNAVVVSQNLNIVAQKISPIGDLVWKADVLVGPESGTVYQEDPVVATDVTGNAFVVWGDYRRNVEDMYIQKINAAGTKTWQTDLRVNSTGDEAFPAVATDSNGNAVVVWASLRDGSNLNIYAQKIDSNGNKLWSKDVQINNTNSFLFYPSVAIDSGGNAFITWEDYPDLYLQKIDSNGNRLWANALLIASNIGDWSHTSSDLAVDGLGNIIIAWRGTVVNGFNMYAQKLNSAGVPQWGNGIQVNAVAGSADDSLPTLAIDNNNNAIVVWPDIRSDNSSAEIYAQKLSSGGSKLWGADVRVNLVNRQTTGSWDGTADISLDGSGNAFVVWKAWPDSDYGHIEIYAQTINSAGIRQWSNDVLVSADTTLSDRANPSISVDSSGNASIVWNDARNGNQDVFAQRINSVGNHSWLSDLQVVAPDLFYYSDGLAQSRTVDTVVGNIHQATLTANTQLNGGNIQFALSNNGGANWFTTTLGTATIFTTTGSDLRWRAMLTGDPIWRNRSPIITSLRIEYSTAVPYADDYEPDDACSDAKPIAVNGAAQAHTFHQYADADWVWFNVISGTTYIIQTANPQLNADTTLELRPSCPQPPLGIDDNALGRDAHLTWRATFSGIVYAKAANHAPLVYGADTGYGLSVHTYTQPPVVVIVGGRDNGFTLQPNIDYLSDMAYRTFLNTGVPKANIRYFSPNPNRDVDGNGLNDDIFATVTITNVRNAIQDWSRTRGVGLGVPFYLYLVDHGYYDQFLAAGSTGRVFAEQLNLWLSNLEATSGADNINVILEACKSGSFIDVTGLGPANISGHNRVVIASTSSVLDAYPSAQGAYFSDAFWTAVGQNQDLKTAFETAKQAVQATGLRQQPWLDDNGDAVANGQDGALARSRGLDASFGDHAPTIDWLLVGDIASGVGTVQAQVRDDFAVDKTWLVVYPPNFVEPPVSADPTTPVLNVPTRTLTLAGGDLFTTSFNGFTQTGWYRLVVYAQDGEEHQALPQSIRLCVNCTYVYLPLIRK